MRKAALGRSGQQEIADEFHISIGTVSGLKTAIMSKIADIAKIEILSQNEREMEVARIAKELEDTDLDTIIQRYENLPQMPCAGSAVPGWYVYSWMDFNSIQVNQGVFF